MLTCDPTVPLNPTLIEAAANCTFLTKFPADTGALFVSLSTYIFLITTADTQLKSSHLPSQSDEGKAVVGSGHITLSQCHSSPHTMSQECERQP